MFFSFLYGAERKSLFFQLREALFVSAHKRFHALLRGFQAGQETADADVEHLKAENAAFLLPEGFPPVPVGADLFHGKGDLLLRQPPQLRHVLLFIGAIQRFAQRGLYGKGVGQADIQGKDAAGIIPCVRPGFQLL